MRISDWSSAVCSSDLPTYVRFLLEHGANPDIRDNQGTTPLMLAVTQNAPGCVAALLNPPAGSRRADVNLANGSGETPLIRAVQLRNLDLVRTLLKAGADPDRKSTRLNSRH